MVGDDLCECGHARARHGHAKFDPFREDRCHDCVGLLASTTRLFFGITMRNTYNYHRFAAAGSSTPPRGEQP